MKKKVHEKFAIIMRCMLFPILMGVATTSTFANTPSGKMALNDEMVLTKNEAKELDQLQQKVVTGKVTDTSGQPLPGVTVVVKGTTRGTVTDNNGNFSLPIPDDAEVLQFSFIGMKTQEIPIEGRTTFTMVMEEETVMLEEVVAVGYGTMQRNRVSASIVSLEPEKVQAQVTSSLDRALEGQIAGLSVRQTTGAPGEEPK